MAGIRRRLAVAAGMALLMVSSPAAEAKVVGHWHPLPRVTFYDGFNDRAGTAPSSARWIHDTGNGTNGWGNLELQYYTAGAANAATDGKGALVITAKRQTAGSCWNGKPCRYTSARILTKTKLTQKYGHIEARIKFNVPSWPAGGYWPAFWALGDDFGVVRWPENGEMDIMENFGYPVVSSALHAPGYDRGNTYSLDRGSRNGWHVYGMDWTHDKVTFTVDGRPYATQTRRQVGKAWRFDHPFFLILNVAVSGTAVPSASSSRWPMSMSVDYVKATT
ncbi:glycoside hydrolase family 16 protein [Streptomyces sp. NPDC005969]|uniref:glycoside hydrolase family 16 protein n=1 Tax=Streptomyces sp. NPDC005969 TaxID=3156722 RepID=UPI0033D0FFFD